LSPLSVRTSTVIGELFDGFIGEIYDQ
jgi:hypothetical protein